MCAEAFKLLMTSRPLQACRAQPALAQCFPPSVNGSGQKKPGKRCIMQHCSIQGSVAIMVYYASLALWVYGLLAYGRADGRSDRVHTVVAAEPAVYLGEPEETIRLRRFVERGGGRTCIRSSRGEGHDGATSGSEAVFLEHPATVLWVIVSVVQKNFWNAEMAHLTLKLMQNMEALGKTVRQPNRQEG
ncbi:unnamed protein product [Clonostachys chloroleuca]|uniref:Uncharacterized protein n=1 Tax=Clonostachys chloroleuca TaxID=1926264 RepID=A0AA35M8S1_9HYPO|nr:unnamed protein product [Clonostachys chloroleuca]